MRERSYGVCDVLHQSVGVCVCVCALDGRILRHFGGNWSFAGVFFVDGPFILWRFMSHYLAQHRGLFVGLFFASLSI